MGEAQYSASDLVLDWGGAPIQSTANSIGYEAKPHMRRSLMCVEHTCVFHTQVCVTHGPWAHGPCQRHGPVACAMPLAMGQRPMAYGPCHYMAFGHVVSCHSCLRQEMTRHCHGLRPWPMFGLRPNIVRRSIKGLRPLIVRRTKLNKSF